MLRIKRGPNQTDRDMIQIYNAEEVNPSAGVDVNQRYFGDSSRMTGIKKPVVNLAPPVPPQTEQDIATANAAAIQDALDSAESDPDIHTIQLPNGKFLCDRLTLGFRQLSIEEVIQVNHSGLTIEGGGKTFVVNKYHPLGLGVIFANPGVIGSFDRVFDYQPGDAGVKTVSIKSEPVQDVVNYEEGQLVYLSPRYYQQSIVDSRICQLNSIDTVTPGVDEIEVTLDDALPTDLEATQATATVKGGGVDVVVITHSYGALYERMFPPRVHLSGGGGSGAVAKAAIGGGAVIEINVANHGSGYTTAPMVVITPAVGESGSGATATAYLNGMNQVDHITVDLGGSKYSAPPTISFTGGGGGVGATADAVIVQSGLVTSVEVMDPGSGYTSPPTVTIDPPPLFSKWVKGGRRVASAGTDYVVMVDGSDVNLFPIDSYVWLCTGPAFDESDGRYFRVRNTVSLSGRVYFTEALRPGDFIADQTCLIPGPFVENVTLRNILCGGFEELFTGNWALNLQNCVNMTVENVQMLRGDGSLVSANMGAFRSQYMRIQNCLGHLENQCAHNLTVTDSVLGAYVTHSHCTDTVFSHCKVSQIDGPFTALGSGTIRFTFRDCEFNFPTTRIVAPEGEDLVFENCVVVNTSDDWAFDGPRVRLSHVRFDAAAGGAISLGASCTDCVLEHLQTPADNSVTFHADTTGFNFNISPEQTMFKGWRVLLRVAEMKEITEPNAPGSDTGALYVRDNGSGKSQLCMRFHTGAIQVIATEP